MARASVLGDSPTIEPDAEDRSAAQRLLQGVGEESQLALKLADGSELPLSEALVKALLALAGELSVGHVVRVLAAETTLTPAETAEVLGLSRPFVVRLLDEGAIPSEHLPGSRHRVVRLEDVLEFQARRERRREGRRKIADAVESADLPY
ncbi:helix-turn-helix domain-containing protein [Nocardiopsis exhalans]|uniref:Helix-turn-helix domain-containing protein n=1 Tax=Nocardiopsis exhalans TaxID=163604 RepID=A0ABY5DA06_9ACTN|nr:helix-turn-helix domain-containing protein [Nocardiopsis exhalans]USY19977.1 helix-turn-helix domain-containing protein [Nocardiopsis exhalans]